MRKQYERLKWLLLGAFMLLVLAAWRPNLGDPWTRRNAAFILLMPGVAALLSSKRADKWATKRAAIHCVQFAGFMTLFALWGLLVVSRPLDVDILHDGYVTAGYWLFALAVLLQAHLGRTLLKVGRQEPPPQA